MTVFAIFVGFILFLIVLHDYLDLLVMKAEREKAED
jgi:hypothetical protein